MRQPREVMELWTQYMNSHEAEKLADLYWDDAENLQLAIGKPLKGKSALLSDFREFFSRIPDTYTHPLRILADGEWAVVEWEGGGTFRHPQDGSRRPFKLSGCGFFQVIEGKIKVQRGYWDKYTWFSQVGLPIE